MTKALGRFGQNDKGIDFNYDWCEISKPTCSSEARFLRSLRSVEMTGTELAGNDFDAAFAQVGVLGVFSNGGPVVPAALTFLV